MPNAGTLTPPGNAKAETAVYACTLDPPLPSPPGLVPIIKKSFLAYTTFGEAFQFEGEDFVASKADYDFAVMFTGARGEVVGAKEDQIASYSARIRARECVGGTIRDEGRHSHWAEAGLQSLISQARALRTRRRG
jgi:hypothetical protein